MCGIFCCVSNEPGTSIEWKKCEPFIRSRGPDFFAESTVHISENCYTFFAASVLWMQGEQPVEQPAQDSSGNVLLWNGDILAGELETNAVSDTVQLLKYLESSAYVPGVLEKIEGPFSFVYLQKSSKRLYFGRDAIGRHSLLMKLDAERRSLVISSVGCKEVDRLVELPPAGIFELNLIGPEFRLTCYPWRGRDIPELRLELENKLSVGIDIGKNLFSPYEFRCLENKDFPDAGELAYLEKALERTYREVTPLEEPQEKENESTRQRRSRKGKEANLCKNGKRKEESQDSQFFLETLDILSEDERIKERVDRLSELLHASVDVRVKKQPRLCRDCIKLRLSARGNEEAIKSGGEYPLIGSCTHSKVGVLFSGGLDSAILAAMVDKCLPEEEEIDLVNIAFERHRSETRQPDRKNSTIKTKCETKSVGDYDVPDRKTGRGTLAELRKISPNRKWNFVEVNISQSELAEMRAQRISHLLYPLCTILDESLGCAVWFASKSQGKLPSGIEYNSPSRILLLGMGADELFGGYMRHRTILRHRGWGALAEELNVELERIAERNLGRDDRVVADNGRQSRLPFLDERVVRFAQELKPWERCYPTEKMPPGLGDKLLLRLLARKIGFQATAGFPKRAFQFGSRIANSSENAKDRSQRL